MSISSSRLFQCALVSLGAVFALAVLFPHILQRLDRAYPFRGVEIMAIDAEYYYATRVQEVLDGFPTVANAYFDAPKHQPYQQPALPEWTIAFLARVFGVSAVPAFLLAKGLFAWFLFVCVAIFFTRVTGRPWESLLACTAFFFAGSALSDPAHILTFLRDPSFSYAFLRFARPVNPQWSSSWFFLTLLFLTSWVEHRKRLQIIFAGVCMAVLLYSYVYAWTYLGATLALLAAWFLYCRDFERCRDLLHLSAVFIVVGIPYFLNLYQSTLHPWFEITAMRQGLVSLRTPVWGVSITVFLFLSFLSRRLWPRTWPLFPALALAGAIALNQQLVTGTYLVPHHYHWYFIQPLTFITLLIALFFFVERYLPFSLQRSAACSLLVFALLFGFLQQSRAYSHARDEWGRWQSFAPVLQYLRARTQPGIVVYATEDTFFRELVPIYTSADVYAAKNAYLCYSPLERARDAFFLDLWLEGLTPDEAEQRFFTDLRGRVSGRFYSIYYRELLGEYTKIPDEVLKRHLQEYKEYHALPLREKLKLYPLHLIVLTPFDTQTPELQQLRAAGKTVYEQGGFIVVSYQG